MQATHNVWKLSDTSLVYHIIATNVTRDVAVKMQDMTHQGYTVKAVRIGFHPVVGSAWVEKD